MGRYYRNKKNIVEDALVISIFKLKEWKLLQYDNCYTTIKWTRSLSGKESSVGLHVYAGQRDEPYISLQYTQTSRSGEPKEYLYNILMDKTTCNYGGQRFWFICPLSKNGVYCGRRVAKLYKGNGDYFGCRHCYNLSYESRNETRIGRFGQLGYLMKAEKQYEELYESIKRWTWRGKPTRKVRKLEKLEHKMDSAVAAGGLVLD